MCVPSAAGRQARMVYVGDVAALENIDHVAIDKILRCGIPHLRRIHMAKPITFADIDTGPSWTEIHLTQAAFAYADLVRRENLKKEQRNANR